MERYKEYKKSKVYWINEIPRSWEQIKVSKIFHSIGSGTTPSSGDSTYYVDKGYNWLQSGDFKDNLVYDTKKKISETALTKYGLTLYPEGSIVIAMYGASIGKVGLLKVATTVNQACCVLFNSPIINIRYGFYSFIAEKNNLIIKSRGGTQPNISQEIIKGHYLLIPPLPEQEKIVNYIESKTSKIDEYIAAKEKEVQLLNELKESEIAKVVTQGLNPDVKMKDSGISWIGRIPEHWGMKRAKFMFNKNKRARRPEDEVITCFRDGQVTLRKNRRLTGFTESEKYDGYQGIRKGDLVIHQMDAFAGSIGVSDSDGMGTSVYHCCTPKGNYSVYYYAYLIRQMAMSGYIQSLYKGIRERSSDFSFPVFGNQYLAIPPRIEQDAIVAYITEKCSKITSLISELQSEIDYLKEYKQRLIADCVTGQVNVQNETI